VWEGERHYIQREKEKYANYFGIGEGKDIDNAFDETTLVF
jgi:hypothetical protein